MKTSISNTYKNAVIALADSHPDDALILARNCITIYMSQYDKETLYHLGQLVERASHGRSGSKITPRDVYNYVGKTFYERSSDYMNHISEYDVHNGVVSATVHGTEDYDTWAAIEDGQIADSSCSCPVRSKCCKHVAAVLLTYASESQLIDHKSETIKEIADCL